LKRKKPNYTFSRVVNTENNGGGSGWSLAGKQKYNELFTAIQLDRSKDTTPLFNQELWRIYEQRGAAKQGKQAATKPKAAPFYLHDDVMPPSIAKEP